MSSFLKIVEDLSVGSPCSEKLTKNNSSCVTLNCKKCFNKFFVKFCLVAFIVASLPLMTLAENQTNTALDVCVREGFPDALIDFVKGSFCALVMVISALCSMAFLVLRFIRKRRVYLYYALAFGTLAFAAFIIRQLIRTFFLAY